MTEERKIAPLERMRFHLAEHYQSQFVALVPETTQPEDLEDPAFFGLVANQCRASGRIFVEREDGMWIADCYIKAVGPMFVMCKVLNVWDLSDYSAEVPQVDATKSRTGYTVKFRGNHYKWGVIRASDQSCIHSGEATQDLAEKWLSEHLIAAAR